jgi:hypothetical protein
MARINKFSETRAFSEWANSKSWKKNLVDSSSSVEDAMSRLQTYSDVFRRCEDFNDYSKNFSGVNNILVNANQYFEASMVSNVRSFSGYLSIERSCEHPHSLIGVDDILGVSDNRVVSPNIGKENLDGIIAKFTTTSSLNPGGVQEYSVATNKKLIMGSVELHLIHATTPNNPVVIKDDGQGTLLAPAGVLAANSDGSVNVKYGTGAIKFTLGTGFVPVTGDTYVLTASEDVSGNPEYGTLNNPGNNRFKLNHRDIEVYAEPDMLVAEGDLMSYASSKKSYNYDPRQVISQKLTELYTKLINKKQVGEIVRGYRGNTYQIDMSSTNPDISSFNDLDSRLMYFSNEFNKVDSDLAYNTTKAVEATAYIVGKNVANNFKDLSAIGKWTSTLGDSHYVSDLVGFFNGRPVLRHTDIPDNEGYAIHKTSGGEMAPVVRGIYMPLVWTPPTSNYNNPTQFAVGAYYWESNKCIFPELIQKFTVKQAH